MSSPALLSLYNPSVPQEEFFSHTFLTTLWSHVGAAVAPAILAAVVCAALVPIAIRLAPRLGLMADPKRDRDIHQHPTARLGGPALFIAFAAAVAWALPADADARALLLLCGVTTLVYLADDRRGIPALGKIGFSVLVALVAIKLFGFQIEFLNLPFLHITNLGLAALPVTLFWIIGMQNTVNLLDGVDGLAAGVVAIVALTLLIAAGGRADQPNVVVMAGALAGACAGFLLFNFHPARIFMGDSGSQFLGLALALLSVLGVAKVAVAFAFVVPVLALSVPIADTAWAIVRRRRRRLSIAHADTEHIHHQLLDFGLTQPETCLLYYGATAILGAVGLMALGHKRTLAVAIVLVVVVLSTLLGERLATGRWQLPAPGLRRLLGVPAAEPGRSIN